MSIKSRFALIFLVTLTLVLAGCAKPPEEEIVSARADLAQAGDAAAETWAAEEWDAAQAAMNAVEEELAAQAGKMGISRSYEHTTELLGDAKAKAETARATAVAKKESARQEAAVAVAAANETLAAAQGAAQALTECPRKPKGFEADMEIMTGNLETLGAEAAALEAHVENERFSTATQEANDLAGEIGVLLADLQAVGEKIGCQPATEN